MTQLAPPPKKTSRRFAIPALSQDPDKRSVQIGIAVTILVHLLLFFLFHSVFKPDGKPVTFYHRPAQQQPFSIELAAPEPEVEKPKPKQFVEANPNANDKKPDKTNNFAAQNQTAAQEKPTPDGKSEHPAIEGQKEIKTSQIVSGQLAKPTEAIPPSKEEATPEKPSIATPRREQNPTTGLVKDQGDNPDGFGSNFSKPIINTSPTVTQHIDGSKDATSLTGATTSHPVIDPKRPRPRPAIVKTQNTRPAIFTENKVGTANIGLIGVSAEFSNYGAYLQRLVEIIQISWDNILNESKVYPPHGTQAVIRFRINKSGEITEIIEVAGDTTDQGKQSCARAITLRSPYDKWTTDMIAILGDNQELVYSFYYQ